MASNVHKVPKKLWNRWDKAEQAAFNRLWKMIPKRGCMEFFVPGVKLTEKQSRCLRWNLCVTVADMLKCWRGNWEFEK